MKKIDIEKQRCIKCGIERAKSYNFCVSGVNHRWGTLSKPDVRQDTRGGHGGNETCDNCKPDVRKEEYNDCGYTVQSKLHKTNCKPLKDNPGGAYAIWFEPLKDKELWECHKHKSFGSGDGCPECLEDIGSREPESKECDCCNTDHGYTSAQRKRNRLCKECGHPVSSPQPKEDWEDQIKLLVNEWVHRAIKLGQLKEPKRDGGFSVYEIPELEPFIRNLLSQEWQDGFDAGFEQAKGERLSYQQEVREIIIQEFYELEEIDKDFKINQDIIRTRNKIVKRVLSILEEGKE